MNEVKLYGVYYSPVSLRVKIALKLKGIEYEYKEEDLSNKSEQLVKYNPIHKKVPVLVHHGKPLAESLVLLEYIDETWKNGYHLLPCDPYERAQVRFWANFIDDKLMNAVRVVLRGKEEEIEKGREEVKNLLKIFQNEVIGKKIVRGNEIGYMELVAIVVALWIPVLLEVVDEDILTKDEFPEFWAWADQILGCDIVKDNIPDRDNLVGFYRIRIKALRAGYGPK